MGQDDFNIEHIDSIVAINILLATYKIDAMAWKREQLEHIVKLLQVALMNPEIK